MKRLLLTLLITLCITFVYAQHPYVQKLGNLAQITFPAKPKPQKNGANTIFVLDTGIIYMAQSTTVGNNEDKGDGHYTDSVYHWFLTGFLKNDSLTLIYKKKISANKLAGMEVMTKAPLHGQIVYRYHQVYYFNGQMFVYSIWASDSVSTNRQKSRPTSAHLSPLYLPTILNRRINIQQLKKLEKLLELALL